MKTVDLSALPLYSQLKIRGALYDTTESGYLESDLFEIGLPSGNWISVGWQPEYNPQGAYWLELWKPNSLVPQCECEATDLRSALEAITRFILSDSQATVSTP